MADTVPNNRLVNELLEIEQRIRKAPAHPPGRPDEVDPELLRLALREAELLRLMRGAAETEPPSR